MRQWSLKATYKRELTEESQRGPWGPSWPGLLGVVPTSLPGCNLNCLFKNRSGVPPGGQRLSHGHLSPGLCPGVSASQVGSTRQPRTPPS